MDRGIRVNSTAASGGTEVAIVHGDDCLQAPVIVNDHVLMQVEFWMGIHCVCF